MLETLRDIVNSLPVKQPELFVGLSIGITVVLLIRAWHIWRYRCYYGYNVYEADRVQRWLHRWAFRAVLMTTIGGIAYWLLQTSKGPTSAPLAVATRPAPILATPARLVIPRVGVNALLISVPIVGWKWDTARMSVEVGHLEGTPEPGGPGNAVVAGHVTDLAGVPGPFWEVASIQLGDYIYVEQRNMILKYEVAEIKRVDPADVDVLYQNTYGVQLTLLTCDEFDASTETYRKRLLIIARRVDS